MPDSGGSAVLVGRSAVDPYPSIALMRGIEERYRECSGLTSRAQYRIFYSRVEPRPVLLLGKNPGGNPDEIDEDGYRSLTKPGKLHSASRSGLYEGNEHELVDCNWRSAGIAELILRLLGLPPDDREPLRSRVVETNVIFRRSLRPAKRWLPKLHRKSEAKAMCEAAPFVGEILRATEPTLVLLCGCDLVDFERLQALRAKPILRAVPDEKVKSTWQPLLDVDECYPVRGSSFLVARIAHGSQWSWMYRYDCFDELRALVCERLAAAK